jgi:hypothetical protein
MSADDDAEARRLALVYSGISVRDMLRLFPYRSTPENPFAGQTIDEEVWAEILNRHKGRAPARVVALADRRGESAIDSPAMSDDDGRPPLPPGFVWAQLGPAPDAQTLAVAQRSWRRLTGRESVTSCERCVRPSDQLALSDRTVPPLWLCPECHGIIEAL